MENLPQLVPLVIFFPLVGFIINVFWGARLGEKWAGMIGSAASLLAFCVALALLGYLGGSGYQAVVVNPPFLDGWIQIGDQMSISWQQRVDTLSVVMMLVVTGVGSLIHIYAIGYMHNDQRFGRFFAYLNLFLVFMLILVTGNNVLMMFVGWEGVGLCSYLLIGFWWDKPNGLGWKNSNAARKAFIVNRVGDFGLLMAIFLVLATFGTLDFYRPGEIANPKFVKHYVEHQADHGEEAAATDDHGAETAATDDHGAAADSHAADDHAAKPLYTYLDNDHIPTEQLGIFGQAQRFAEEGRQVTFGPFTLNIQTVVSLIALFMLLGAAGKSAQIPLFVWLPDAMAGPTPVSALIHAATMVTAGVYMMVRANVFYEMSALVSLLVALVGAGTAIVAGFIAIGQWDIKRVLAYSTISQLGFMVAAVGVGAFGAAMFHLVTHAFFKALLFLGSGSVIHGVEHGAHETHDHVDPQDMRVMGGLKSKMPLTYWTYLIGTLALAGIFPLAGFWSKDEILADAWNAGLYKNDVGGYLALGILLAAAGFTAFYMWRQIEMVFYGQARSEAAAHAHESSRLMTTPLVILAFFSVFIGFINVPGNLGGIIQGVFGEHRFTEFLEASVLHAHAGELNWLLAIIATAVGLGGIFAARSVYGHGRALTANKQDPLEVNPNTGLVWSFAHARMYWDETYHRLFVAPFEAAARFLAHTLDWAFWHDYFHNTVIVNGFNTIGRLLSKPFDLGIIDGAVNGIGWLIRVMSGRVRVVQTGYVRTYAVALLLGVVAVIVIMLLPMIQSGS